jgi:hypothetical protein
MTLETESNALPSWSGWVVAGRRSLQQSHCIHSSPPSYCSSPNTSSLDQLQEWKATFKYDSRTHTMSSRALRGPSVLSASQRDVLRSHLKSAFNGYLRHRPLVERALTAGFVLYCVGSTYLSLTGRGGKRESGRESGRRGRAKGESDPGLLDPVL